MLVRCSPRTATGSGTDAEGSARTPGRPARTWRRDLLVVVEIMGLQDLRCCVQRPAALSRIE